MKTKGFWRWASLAMMAFGAYIVWWANYSMVSKDREAPFVMGAFGVCIFVPLCLIWLVIAAFMPVKPKEKPFEPSVPLEAGDFRWKSSDDEAE